MPTGSRQPVGWCHQHAVSALSTSVLHHVQACDTCWRWAGGAQHCAGRVVCAPASCWQLASTPPPLHGPRCRQPGACARHCHQVRATSTNAMAAHWHGPALGAAVVLAMLRTLWHARCLPMAGPPARRPARRPAGPPCLPACSRAFLLACLLAHLACLPARPPACLLACLPVCSHACMHACSHARCVSKTGRRV